MLKETLSSMFNIQSRTVNNAIIQLGDTDDSGKGKHFKSRFVQPGIAGYPERDENLLITKESFDRFIHTLKNKPVIINHKDEITEDDKVGEVHNVWYNPDDGWYWCDGIITDKYAMDLIKKHKWSVSCSYDILKADDEGGSENNIKYGMEILDGEFKHLAIVKNPRYERANIVFNSKTQIINGNPDQPRVPKGNPNGGQFAKKNNSNIPNYNINPNYQKELKQIIDKAKNNPNERQKLLIGEVSDDLVKEAKDNGLDISGYNHDLDVSGTRHAFKEHGTEKTEIPRGQIPIEDSDFEKIPKVIYEADEIKFTGKNKTGLETITYKKTMPDNIVFYVEEIRTGQKTLTINTMYKHKNTDDPRTSANNSNPLSNVSIYIIPPSDTNLNPNVKNNKETFEEAFTDVFFEALAEVLLETYK